MIATSIFHSRFLGSVYSTTTCLTGGVLITTIGYAVVFIKRIVYQSCYLFQKSLLLFTGCNESQIIIPCSIICYESSCIYRRSINTSISNCSWQATILRFKSILLISTLRFSSEQQEVWRFDYECHWYFLCCWIDVGSISWWFPFWSSGHISTISCVWML